MYRRATLLNNGPQRSWYNLSEPAQSRCDLNTDVPVLVLGGRENALSITRNLGRHGIPVRVSGPQDCWGRFSRHCKQAFTIPKGTSHRGYWEELLLSGNHRQLHGSVLLCGSDTALEFVAANQDALLEQYRLPDFHSELTLALLDKKKTLELAREANVPAPGFWDVKNERDLEALEGQLAFPVMVKPIHSHRFIPVMGRKLFIVKSGMDELAAKVRLCWEKGLEIMVVEMIPGPDSTLSSYYTYLDRGGDMHFEYTKRVIRRYPENRGLTCHHASPWLPETAQAGRAFFRGIGFYGLGNIEFKRDPRDNLLKVIESNARFTAAQELVLQCGIPIDLICYCHATGQARPEVPKDYADLRMWYGFRDTLAFLEQRKSGNLTASQWLRSIEPMKSVSPLHDFRDPFPTLGALSARISKSLGKS